MRTDSSSTPASGSILTSSSAAHQGEPSHASRLQRVSSSSYFDIANTILGSSGDLDEVLLCAARVSAGHYLNLNIDGWLMPLSTVTLSNIHPQELDWSISSFLKECNAGSFCSMNCKIFVTALNTCRENYWLHLVYVCL